MLMIIGIAVAYGFWYCFWQVTELAIAWTVLTILLTAPAVIIYERVVNEKD